MLAVPADRLPTALAELDPGNRALLDLSLRRGVSDAEIGELLSKRPDEVARGRDAVLELLADALGVAGHDRRERVRHAVAALPDEAWRGHAPPAPAPEPPPERAARPEPPPPEPGPAPPEEPEEPAELDEQSEERPMRRQPAVYIAPGEGRRPRRAGMLAAIGLLAVVVALGLLVFGGGDDEEPAPTGDGNGAEPAPDDGGAQEEIEVPLRAVGGGDGGGRVGVAPDGQVVISVRDLPPADGSYQAWLYNSVVDATGLGTLDNPNARLTVRLPAEAGEYRFIDVSREPADGNANHSGESVLRAPLAELLQG